MNRLPVETIRVGGNRRLREREEREREATKGETR